MTPHIWQNTDRCKSIWKLAIAAPGLLEQLLVQLLYSFVDSMQCTQSCDAQKESVIFIKQFIKAMTTTDAAGQNCSILGTNKDSLYKQPHYYQNWIYIVSLRHQTLSQWYDTVLIHAGAVAKLQRAGHQYATNTRSNDQPLSLACADCNVSPAGATIGIIPCTDRLAACKPEHAGGLRHPMLHKPHMR
jgi:hypothetical protein